MGEMMNLPHVLHTLYKAVLVSISSEFRILRRSRIKMLQTNHPIIRENSFNPNSANVISAAGSQHVGHRRPGGTIQISLIPKHLMTLKIN